jgi:hypothetical protein
MTPNAAVFQDQDAIRPGRGDPDDGPTGLTPAGCDRRAFG